MKFIFYVISLIFFKFTFGFSELKLDGYILEINNLNDYNEIMNKIDYSLFILFKNYHWDKQFNLELQKITEILIKHTPAVGVIKINCNKFHLNICDNLKTKIEKDYIPELVFTYRDNKNEFQYENIKIKNYENKIKSEGIINEIKNLILMKSIPYIIKYENEDSNFITILNSKIKNHFVLLYKDDNSIIDEYENISKQFRELNHKIWFTYLNVNNIQNDLEKEELPILFFYDNFNQTLSDVTKDFIFEKDDINFSNLIQFYEKYKYNDDTINLKLDENDFNLNYTNKTKSLKSFPINNTTINQNYYIVLFYKTDKSNLNSNTFKKWNFMLERLNFIINKKYNKISFFKLDIDNNPKGSLIQIPQEFKLKNFGISLYIYNKTYLIYTKGPSLNLFVDFLNENLKNLNLKLPEEEIQDYFKEIFYNSEYFDVDMDNLDEIEDEIFKDMNYTNNKEDL